MLLDAQVEMTARVAYIIRITQIPWKKIDCMIQPVLQVGKSLKI